MTPGMQRALIELSTYYHPDPALIFRRVLQAVSAQYGDTMAMINLLEGDRIRYRDIVNPHPLFRRRNWTMFHDSY
jgi:hypothetical protein